MPAATDITPDKISERPAGVLPRRGQVQNAPDSDINVEVWLPLENWKGVFHGTGNGGFGGL